MTCIIHGARTKKELREKCNIINAGNPEVHLAIEDPSIFNSRYFAVTDMKIGQGEVVTNHPKRSWFARITRTEKGFRVE